MLAPWLGGKARIAGRLIPMFPPHRCYVEVFGGMASVLLNKPSVDSEIYNDRDERLVGLFAVLKYHGAEFDREMRGLLKSRRIFELFREQPGLTDIQRAARFLYCHLVGFGGMGRTFGTGKGSGGAQLRSLESAHAMIERIRTRLATVTVEHLDWEACLEKYDSPDTFFFLDPPYDQTAGYAVPFSERDQQVLAERLRMIRGKFLQTNSDNPRTRSWYRGFKVSTLRSAYGLRTSSCSAFVHLVVKNY